MRAVATPRFECGFLHISCSKGRQAGRQDTTNAMVLGVANGHDRVVCKCICKRASVCVCWQIINLTVWEREWQQAGQESCSVNLLLCPQFRAINTQSCCRCYCCCCCGLLALPLLLLLVLQPLCCCCYMAQATSALLTVLQLILKQLQHARGQRRRQCEKE